MQTRRQATSEKASARQYHGLDKDMQLIIYVGQDNINQILKPGTLDLQSGAAKFLKQLVNSHKDLPSHLQGSINLGGDGKWIKRADHLIPDSQKKDPSRLSWYFYGGCKAPKCPTRAEKMKIGGPYKNNGTLILRFKNEYCDHTEAVAERELARLKRLEADEKASKAEELKMKKRMMERQQQQQDQQRQQQQQQQDQEQVQVQGQLTMTVMDQTEPCPEIEMEAAPSTASLDQLVEEAISRRNEALSKAKAIADSTNSSNNTNNNSMIAKPELPSTTPTPVKTKPLPAAVRTNPRVYAPPMVMTPDLMVMMARPVDIPRAEPPPPVVLSRGRPRLERQRQLDEAAKALPTAIDIQALVAHGQVGAATANQESPWIKYQPVETPSSKKRTAKDTLEGKSTKKAATSTPRKRKPLNKKSTELDGPEAIDTNQDMGQDDGYSEYEPGTRPTLGRPPLPQSTGQCAPYRAISSGYHYATPGCSPNFGVSSPLTPSSASYSGLYVTSQSDPFAYNGGSRGLASALANTEVPSHLSSSSILAGFDKKPSASTPMATNMIRSKSDIPHASSPILSSFARSTVPPKEYASGTLYTPLGEPMQRAVSLVPSEGTYSVMTPTHSTYRGFRRTSYSSHRDFYRDHRAMDNNCRLKPESVPQSLPPATAQELEAQCEESVRSLELSTPVKHLSMIHTTYSSKSGGVGSQKDCTGISFRRSSIQADAIDLTRERDPLGSSFRQGSSISPTERSGLDYTRTSLAMQSPPLSAKDEFTAGYRKQSPSITSSVVSSSWQNQDHPPRTLPLTLSASGDPPTMTKSLAHDKTLMSPTLASPPPSTTASPPAVQLRTVSIRSPKKLLTHVPISISSSSTFADLIGFVIPPEVQLPSGTRWGIRSSDLAQQYLSNAKVVETILGVEHAEVVVMTEKSADFQMDDF